MSSALLITLLSELSGQPHLLDLPTLMPALAELSTQGDVWQRLAAGGLMVGVTIFYPSDGGLGAFRQVAYATVRCAWCKGKGTDLLFFRCRVCSGHGRVMAAKPQRRCAWCKGKGRELLAFRCRVCKGTGWAHGRVNFG